MKKLSLILSCFFLLTIAKSSEAQTKEKWPELETFHEVMSKTFHPAEEGNLDPIKTRSYEMVQKAIVWKNSTAPSGYDKNAVKKTLKKLVKGAKELNNMVQRNAADNEIKEELTELHEVFHEITEKCKSGDHH
ncbi:MAG TPA: hypothetical protein PK275_04655 [Chitinophagaceae bacterium]|nr:hypothetical protein [Chitinophagaceae bacterium]